MPPAKAEPWVRRSMNSSRPWGALSRARMMVAAGRIGCTGLLMKLPPLPGMIHGFVPSYALGQITSLGEKGDECRGIKRRAARAH
jgi:hypothetical protein